MMNPIILRDNRSIIPAKIIVRTRHILISTIISMTYKRMYINITKSCI